MTRPAYRRVRNALVGLVLPPTTVLFGALSWPAAQRAGAQLGLLAARCSRRTRQRTLAHLDVAFPDLPAEQKQSLARACYRSQGMNLGECLHLLRRRGDTAWPHLRVEGWRHVETAREKGRGVLIVSGHCGNWELFGPAFRKQKTALTAVARAPEDSWAHRFALEFRSRLGTEMVHRGESSSARKLLNVLRKNGCLIVLVDQDFRTDGVWVPFFGQPAHTPTGPAQLAIKYSLTAVPAFCQRLEDGSHRIRFSPPLQLGNDLREATASMTQAVEAQIRACPEQWLWMHRRWRRQPGEQDSPLE